MRSLAGKPSGPISLSDLYGKSAAAPVQPLTLYPNGTNTQQNSNAGGGTVSINLSVAATGGARPLTYQWIDIQSTNGAVQVTGTDGPSLNFQRTFNANTSGSITAQARCVVTAANGEQKTTGLVQGSAGWGVPA